MDVLLAWWHYAINSPLISTAIAIVALFAPLVTLFLHLRDRDMAVHNGEYLIWLKRQISITRGELPDEVYYEVVLIDTDTLQFWDVYYSRAKKDGRYDHYGKEISSISFWGANGSRTSAMPPKDAELELDQHHVYPIFQLNDRQSHEGFVELLPNMQFQLCDIAGDPESVAEYTAADIAGICFLGEDEGVSLAFLDSQDYDILGLPDSEAPLPKDAVLEDGKVYSLTFDNGSQWAYVYCHTRVAFLRLVNSNGSILAINTRGTYASTWRTSNNITARKLTTQLELDFPLKVGHIYQIKGYAKPMVCEKVFRDKLHPRSYTYSMRVVSKRGLPLQSGGRVTISSSGASKNHIPMGTPDEYSKGKGVSIPVGDSAAQLAEV